MKYNLGDKIYWVEAGAYYGKQIPCPMCFGKLFVTITLGDDSQEKIECGLCSHGVDRPSGIARTWGPSSFVKSGIITGISNKDGIRYEVGYTTLYQHEIVSDEKTAEVLQETKLKEVTALADQFFKENFITIKKRQVWSANYHRECIKDQERKIEWHRMRLGMITDRKKVGKDQEPGGEG
jgi:hypothetical protein